MRRRAGPSTAAAATHRQALAAMSAALEATARSWAADGFLPRQGLCRKRRGREERRRRWKETEMQE
jgi:hypothetical protein